MPSSEKSVEIHRMLGLSTAYAYPARVSRTRSRAPHAARRDADDDGAHGGPRAGTIRRHHVGGSGQPGAGVGRTVQCELKGVNRVALGTDTLLAAPEHGRHPRLR
jgi:hypothetical protein